MIVIVYLQPTLLAFALLIKQSTLAVRARVLVVVRERTSFICAEVVFVNGRTAFAASFLVAVIVVATPLTEYGGASHTLEVIVAIDNVDLK